ncbi:MAG: HAMP domain-containing sensor histidine kinase [Inconstantimicrobium porci]|uniref:sensor histidine kinase n=1 Tax=Inconstantimicrobium porci TaxID=2652291 RepID=UPI002A915EC6|nr:HAMP domain-containing sensor histidine kinase [Inconstantimicrobium porci]MDY5911828.1 HAMP domain-containing sensor histidine kinase [Inconstantimicrobium porci]
MSRSRDRHRGRGHHFMYDVVVLSIFVVQFLLFYFLVNLKAALVGIFINLLSFVFGLIIYYLFFIKHVKDSHKFMYDIYKAIDEISNGNFSVALNAKEFDVNHHIMELADKVNNMAEGLRSMETMRVDFVSDVSHEIQSPLTSIKGFTALLKDDDLSSEDRKKYIDIIEDESSRLSKLSYNLLKLSALDSGAKELKFEEFDLSRQLRETVLSFEPQWSVKNIDFTADCPKTIISGDMELIKEVWINLINNGIKFTPDGGSMNVTLKNDGHDVEVKVSDSGIGIKKEDQQHIFERFYMADKSRKRVIGGNGLGLAIVKKIVMLHNGTIKVESEEGKGTSFIVKMPVNHV